MPATTVAIGTPRSVCVCGSKKISLCIDVVGERAFDVRHRHVVEVLLVQQHARARVVDVEERLQVGERVGGAQRVDRVVRELHAVALARARRSVRVRASLRYGCAARPSARARFCRRAVGCHGRCSLLVGRWSYGCARDVSARSVATARGASRCFDRLQQLRCRRNRDDFRRLVDDAIDADRAHHARDPRRVDAARRQPVLELLALRVRADHAEEREVAAPQDALGQLEIDARGCASSR